jgi:hypothetical protein
MEEGACRKEGEWLEELSCEVGKMKERGWKNSHVK